MDLEISQAIRGRRHPQLVEVLGRLYPEHRLLTAWGTTFPVIALADHNGSPGNPDAVLDASTLDLTVEPDRELVQAGQPYIDMLISLGAYLYDAETYALHTLGHDASGYPQLRCAYGTYFDALRTCDALEWELFHAISCWPEYHGDMTGFLAAELPLRNRVHDLAGRSDPLVAMAGRSAALAISTLVLCRRKNEWVVLLGDRSERGVAMHGDVFHVIPSCMFQPVTGHRREEFSLTHNFYREYLEELCGLEEVAIDSSMRPDYFQRDPNYLYLTGLIDRGEATLTLSGMVVNPLNLRPEVCLLLCIDTPDWFDDHAAGRHGLSRIEFGGASWQGVEGTGPNAIPIAQIEAEGIEQEVIVPPGAGAIILGLGAASRLGRL